MAQTVELKPVKRLMMVLLTWKLSSAVAESLTILKIQEQGMPKEHAATISLLLTPLQIIIPMVVTKYTAGERPLDLAKAGAVGAHIPLAQTTP
jgi:PAT family acetyl-CoA transporter-like MFS transporter 1